MRSLKAPRRDPAPSRVSYRWQRLWLTPLFRFVMRVGLPLAAIALGFGWFFGQQANRDAAMEKYAEIRRSIEERPEFMVQLMAIDGASPAIAQEIREELQVDMPISSFDLDLPEMKEKIQVFDAVAKVDLRVRKGGILQVQITERVPAVVWRFGLNLDLLDTEGRRVVGITRRGARPDLPLLAGEGADLKVPEALSVLAVAGPVRDRVRGLVRVGERRWDLVLDRNQRILLPEENPVQALEQAMALEQATEMLARDVLVVDMRNNNRPTLRMAPPAVAELRRTKDMKPGAAER